MTVTESVYGYLQMIYNLRNYFDQDVMLGILSNIKEDALTYPWDNVRNFYRVLSSMVEMNRVQWTDTEQISTLRYHYAHRPANMYRAQQAAPSDRQTGYPIKTCAAYQRGESTEAGGHVGFVHACVFCARMKQTAYPRTDKDCRGKKFMQSQNAYIEDIVSGGFIRLSGSHIGDGSSGRGEVYSDTTKQSDLIDDRANIHSSPGNLGGGGVGPNTNSVFTSAHLLDIYDRVAACGQYNYSISLINKNSCQQCRQHRTRPLSLRLGGHLLRSILLLYLSPTCLAGATPHKPLGSPQYCGCSPPMGPQIQGAHSHN